MSNPGFDYESRGKCFYYWLLDERALLQKVVFSVGRLGEFRILAGVLMSFPHETFHRSLVREIANSGQTIAGLGRTLSRINDKLPRTNERMISRLRDRLNPQVIELIILLDALGLELTIVPRRAGDAVESASAKDSTEKQVQ
jgi:hypothetical protein